MQRIFFCFSFLLTSFTPFISSAQEVKISSGPYTSKETGDLDAIFFESGPGTVLEELFCLLKYYHEGDSQLINFEYPHPSIAELDESHSISCSESLSNEWTEFWTPGFFFSVEGKKGSFKLTVFDEDTALKKFEKENGRRLPNSLSARLSEDKKTLTISNHLLKNISSVIEFSSYMGLEKDQAVDNETNIVIERKKYKSFSGKITAEIETSFPTENKDDTLSSDGEVVIHF